MVERKNLVLIGMPGCGKTTIGSLISNRLGMVFADIDQYIENKGNKTITDIFKISEEYFRNIESKCTEEISKGFDKVICTGAGIVKRDSNMICLRKNSFIVFINRPIENIISDIDTTTRPLLKDNTDRLYNLYNDRINLYKRYCHIEVVNDKGIDYIVEKIIYEFTKLEAKSKEEEKMI